MLMLTIESSCDETAAAVVDGDLVVRSTVVASQNPLHQRFGGVVPEIASRAHVERILPVIDEALQRSGCRGTDIDLIAVTTTPGLAGSLLVGLAAAKALAVAWRKPLVTVNHLHAHIYACRMLAGPRVFPCVGLIVSGGHTHLVRCRGPLEFSMLGGTHDDAAGEAFDKVASLLGLPYPGGPALAAWAERGDPRAYAFPRSYLGEPDRIAFSFSGLKTAVRYALAAPPAVPPDPATIDDRTKANLAASFQEAVVDVLVAKSMAALQQCGYDALCVGGGVAANRRLRARLAEVAAARGVRLYIAPPELCTDNAVMAALAIERWRAGEVDSLEVDIVPGVVRAAPGAG